MARGIASLRAAAAAVTLLLLVSSSDGSKMTSSVHDLTLLIDQTQLIHIIQIGEVNTTVEIKICAQHQDLVQIVPSDIFIEGKENANSSIVKDSDVCFVGLIPGHTEIYFNVTPAGIIDVSDLFMTINIQISNTIVHISAVMGWVYFVAWSVSFYPQIYINWKRKSVVGLNFDFVSLNLVGFAMYSLFNVGLFFIPSIFAEYKKRNPRGQNPIQVNDIFFSLHAAFATIITIVQCVIYERADQSVSKVGRGLLVIFATVFVVSLGLAAGSVLTWLDFLYYCSYIKLTITFIKYLPQAYMNYKRKSTVGWSIGNIFLDFTGGFLSILQMLLNAYNFNDWASIFGDFTKFGLGLFSLTFDIFFMLQHYVFYRSPHLKLTGILIEKAVLAPVKKFTHTKTGAEEILLKKSKKRENNHFENIVK